MEPTTYLSFEPKQTHNTMELPSSAVLSKGSYVCVTGANGLVGSYVVDELLTFGLRELTWKFYFHD